MKMDEEKIVALSKEGLGARKIASRLGYDHQSSVYKVLKKHGLNKKSTEDENGDFNRPKINKDNIRKAAEHFARFYFSLMGKNFLIPSPEAPYDLVLDEIGFQKVQIKSSSHMKDGNNYCFSLIRTRTNTKGIRKNKYSKKECDLFFLLDAEINAWLVPFEVLEGMKAVTPKNSLQKYRIW